jgi:hypothetical protein
VREVTSAPTPGFLVINKLMHRIGWPLVALLCWVPVTACKSTKPKTGPGADSLASIEVQGHTALEVARAVSETFKAAGYEAIPLQQNDDLRMQFEKPAGTGQSILYSDWSFKPIWFRVRIRFIKTDAGSYVVTCNVWRVNERGDPHFEEEHKLSGMKRGPYQDLLDQAKAKLVAPGN